MIFRLLFIGILLTAGTVKAEHHPYQLMPGDYKVVIAVADPEEKYPVHIEMSVGELGKIKNGTLTYPTYDCKSNISQSKQQGLTIVFEEEMVDGYDICVSSRYTLTFNQNSFFVPTAKNYFSLKVQEDGSLIDSSIETYHFTPSKLATFRLTQKLINLDDLLLTKDSSKLRKVRQLVSNQQYLRKINSQISQLEVLESTAYERAVDSQDLVKFEEFVKKFPGSAHIKEAKSTIVRIKRQNLIAQYRKQATPDSIYLAYTLSNNNKDINTLLTNHLTDLTTLKQFIQDKQNLKNHRLIQKKQAEFFRQHGGFEGYMRAYLVAKDKKDIDIAYQHILSSDKGSLDKKLLQNFYNEYTVYGTISGTKDFKDAKFINGLIWQDEDINGESDYMRYSSAKQYCENLTLLGVDGWRLPSVNDFEQLGNDMTLLYNRANNPFKFKSYFTHDEGCSQEGFFEIPQSECVNVVNISVNKTPYFSKDRKGSLNSVRCVLTTAKYAIYKNEIGNQEAQKETFAGYLNAFIATGQKQYIKQANQLAKSTSDKKKLEVALVDHFGINNRFKINGSMNHNSTDDTGQSNYEAGNFFGLSGIIAGMQSSGEAIFSYTISPNPSAQVPLKYGNYNLQIRAALQLTYETVSFGIGMTEHEKVIALEDVTLTPDNNWNASGTINFGEIVEGNKGHLLGITVSKKITDMSLALSIENKGN